ncbi:MAG: nucleoside triphosphate pyrophosphohydrolase [Gemmatimonadota bacterium]|jgi:tetrapyrrole methylase family protein/MazG family protein|nr:nucleoside triphosphate pyrophosphohydrolase [Gemmatimonadota bacterium]MDP6803474.1 nucleoside triphosphate pyrophosphohydrolase [Gemmatimonadota bacterium]MDP7032596.1 nucleoside triphosphate pyrophosphohydrolase [Gemmatimonadota bacterium]
MPVEAFRRLLELEHTLRAPGGCPWDAAQTVETLKPNLLEETYEVLEAHSSGDRDEFREECGDLLYVLMFLAIVAEDEGYFSVEEMIRGAHEKIHRRHPHVFGDARAEDPEDAKRVWEEVKKREGKEGRESVLDGIPHSLPALMRSRRVQERAAAVGFDWKNPDDVFAKVEEEMEEVRTSYHAGQMDDAVEELGDVLFAVVNLLRFLNRNPEEVLVGTIKKFENRFRQVEEAVNSQSRRMTLEEMERVWEKAKRDEGRSTS